jgi:uncharacterized protein
MFERHRELIREFFACSAAGVLPDEILCEDMTAWTTTQGQMDRAAYQHIVTYLPKMTRDPIQFFIDAITCEDDRGVAEVHSQATLIDGSDYQNTYVFTFRFREGRITHVSEHFNALIVSEKLVPLMKAIS